MDPRPIPAKSSLIGRDVGPYRIVEELGSGGMGTVYRAVDRALERPVALKILFDLEDPENINRFRREARALGKLGHANTIQIYWVGEVEGFPCFAMEYCEGGVSVYDLLKENGILPAEAAVDIVMQAARGLEAARTAGVVHRDIKPNNLLIAPDGTVKIADFGLAKLTQDANNELTQSGIIMGTPYYMSPEQGQGEPIDHRADQYSLGATFYHMLTGFTPFEAENPVSLIIKHVREPLPDLRRVSPSTPDALRKVIEKMMAKNPAHRYDSYEELIEDLESFTRGQQLVHARTTKLVKFNAAHVPVWVYVAGGILIGTGLMYGLSQLGEMPTPTATPLTQASVTATASTPVPVDTPPPDPEALSDARAAKRASAAVALGRARDDSEEALVELMRLAESDPDTSVRARAAWALGQIGNQEATPALAKLVRDEDPRVALASIEALGHLADIRAVDPLTRAAREHADPDVRAAAAKVRDQLFTADDSGPTVGGHGERWWRSEFRGLRTRVDTAAERARELEQAARYYEQRYGFEPTDEADALNGETRNVFETVYAAARTEQALAEREKQLATRALKQLTTTADAQGVPPDWRG